MLCAEPVHCACGAAGCCAGQAGARPHLGLVHAQVVGAHVHVQDVALAQLQLLHCAGSGACTTSCVQRPGQGHSAGSPAGGRGCRVIRCSRRGGHLGVQRALAHDHGDLWRVRLLDELRGRQRVLLLILRRHHLSPASLSGRAARARQRGRASLATGLCCGAAHANCHTHGQGAQLHKGWQHRAALVPGAKALLTDPAAPGPLDNPSCTRPGFPAWLRCVPGRAGLRPRRPG